MILITDSLKIFETNKAPGDIEGEKSIRWKKVIEEQRAICKRRLLIHYVFFCLFNSSLT